MTDEINFDAENAAGEGLFEPEPADEPIDKEINNIKEDAEVSETDLSDLNEVLNFFNEVLQNHEQAIAILAAAVFGGNDGSQVPEQGNTDSADGGSEGDNVIPITTDITGTIKPA